MTRLAAAATAGVLVALALPGPVAPARAAIPDSSVDCAGVERDAIGPVEAAGQSPLFDLLDLADAQRAVGRSGAPGSGVIVAVVDSGVVPVGGMSVDSTTVPGIGQLGVGDSAAHGTTVAGIIAGQPRGGDPAYSVGVAPGASILDVKVYDTEVAQENQPGIAVDGANVLAGLRSILALVSGPNPPRIKVVNVSLAVPDVPGMQEVITELWDRGVVVVAASGNRPGEGSPLYDELGTAENGQDARGLVFPAGYDHVVAVSTTLDGADTAALDAVIVPNSAIDVATPTAGAISYARNGDSCSAAAPATSWASAVVSGVLALLWQQQPQASPAQIVARLVDTASGRPDVPTVYTGAGVIQPEAALTRRLDPARDGTVPGTEIDRGAAGPVPEASEPPDLLASVREKTVWWGLFAGGALVLALVLRPVLARRRR